MTHTDPQGDAAVGGTLPTIPVPANPSEPYTPEWFYNEIMRHIEPDLLLEVIPELDRIYDGESEEEFMQRMAAYNEAFSAFDAAYETLGVVIGDAVKDVKKEARSKALRQEREERHREEQAMDGLLSSDNT